LREYRAKQVTLQYLRPVIAILREELGVRYPLATLKPYTSGRSLALKVQKQVGLEPSLNIVVLGRDGSVQLTDTAAAFLEKVDFDDDGTGDARRLYPLGRSVPVVLDPDHGFFGEPTLTSGARTETIAELVASADRATASQRSTTSLWTTSTPPCDTRTTASPDLVPATPQVARWFAEANSLGVAKALALFRSGATLVSAPRVSSRPGSIARRRAWPQLDRSNMSSPAASSHAAACQEVPRDNQRSPTID